MDALSASSKLQQTVAMRMMLGSQKFAAEKVQEAIEEWESAIDMLSSLDSATDKEMRAMILGSTGIAYHRLGNYEKALELLEKGATASREAGVEIGAIRAQVHMANVYGCMGRWEDAQKRLGVVQILAKGKNFREIQADALHYLGWLHWAYLRFDDAEKCHKEELEIALAENVQHLIGRADGAVERVKKERPTTEEEAKAAYRKHFTPSAQ